VRSQLLVLGDESRSSLKVRSILICEFMPPNPFDPPSKSERPEKPSVERGARLSGWWIAVCYSMPLFIVLTIMNEAGWYGTGRLGLIQSLMRICAFVTGSGCAYYVLIRGTMTQKLAAAPAALGYTLLVLGILWDNYL
jgi:hypothetical protein